MFDSAMIFIIKAVAGVMMTAMFAIVVVLPSWFLLKYILRRLARPFRRKPRNPDSIPTTGSITVPLPMFSRKGDRKKCVGCETWNILAARFCVKCGKEQDELKPTLISVGLNGETHTYQFFLPLDCLSHHAMSAVSPKQTIPATDGRTGYLVLQGSTAYQCARGGWRVVVEYAMSTMEGPKDKPKEPPSDPNAITCGPASPFDMPPMVMAHWNDFKERLPKTLLTYKKSSHPIACQHDA